MNFLERILQFPLSVWFCLASFRDGTIFCFLCFELTNWPFWIFLNFFLVQWIWILNCGNSQIEAL